MAVRPGRVNFELIMFAVLMSALAPSAPGQSTDEFGTESWLAGALRGRIFFLPPFTQRLPGLDSLRPEGTIYAHELNVPTTAWQQGYPGVKGRLEWFAIEYEGIIRAHHSGHYLFRLVSDDGSKLYIDNKLVIDNDGVHPTRSAEGSVDLDAFQHRIRIQYFQGPRYYVALQLFCSSNGFREQVFPNCGVGLQTPDVHSVFKPEPMTDVWSVFKPDMTDVKSQISYSNIPCLAELDLCTPDRVIIEPQTPGRYHIVLPALAVWGVSMPNPGNLPITISNAAGTVCDTTVADHALGCNGWQGSTRFDRAGEGYLLKDEKPGALIYHTVGGRTIFSVNGNKRGVIKNSSGALEFKDYRGSFQFDVEFARFGQAGTITQFQASPTKDASVQPLTRVNACSGRNDGQWHRFGESGCTAPLPNQLR